MVLENRLEKLKNILSVQKTLPEKIEGVETLSNVIKKYSNVKDFDENEIKVAGRIKFIRKFGKASFIKIQEQNSLFQLFISKNDVTQEVFEIFKNLDVGDIICAQGNLFRTKTGELTLFVKSLELLTKCLHDLPEKFHGLKDYRLRYTKRYLDLIVNKEVFDIFLFRFEIINFIRNYLVKKGFIEVETPVLQPIYGGGIAKPFITHHNTYNMDLYLRISPELYLKRLLVGGFLRVFEFAKNFRNEGISNRHNPEFTMLEFYISYYNFEDLVDFLVEMLNDIALQFKDRIKNHNLWLKENINYIYIPKTVKEFVESNFNFNAFDDEQKYKNLLLSVLRENNIEIKTEYKEFIEVLEYILFDEIISTTLKGLVFVFDFPSKISPLAKAYSFNKKYVQRFELFFDGKELANGFSELNDPFLQKERFLEQLKLKNREKIDEDYVTALEYGLQPCAGVGIGIDRLVCFLLGLNNIREVILFPLLRDNE